MGNFAKKFNLGKCVGPPLCQSGEPIWSWYAMKDANQVLVREAVKHFLCDNTSPCQRIDFVKHNQKTLFVHGKKCRRSVFDCGIPDGIHRCKASVVRLYPLPLHYHFKTFISKSLLTSVIKWQIMKICHVKSGNFPSLPNSPIF